MSGNTLDLLLSVTIFGESHGPVIGAVTDDCPPDMTLPAEDIQLDLDRRELGTSRHVTQRKEEDPIEILSDVYEDKTTGAPVRLLTRSTDQHNKDYSNITEALHPGHADYTYWHKYGIRDPHGGGRSPVRLTMLAAAAGAVAKKRLREKFGIEIRGFMSQLGDIQVLFMDWNKVPNNPFPAPNVEVVPELETYMDALRKDGDSVGTRAEVVTTGVSVGWGEPLFDRLDADTTHAMMRLNAVKGVEIGTDFHAVNQHGSEHGDELMPKGFVGNNVGDILGGILTGQDISALLAIKPTLSVCTPRRSIDKVGDPAVIGTFGRHDPCIGIRTMPVAEALSAIVLVNRTLRHRVQCSDVLIKTPAIATKAS